MWLNDEHLNFDAASALDPNSFGRPDVDLLYYLSVYFGDWLRSAPFYRCRVNLTRLAD